MQVQDNEPNNTISGRKGDTKDTYPTALIRCVMNRVLSPDRAIDHRACQKQNIHRWIEAAILDKIAPSLTAQLNAALDGS